MTILCRLMLSGALLAFSCGHASAADWAKQAAEDAKQDRHTFAYDGVKGRLNYPDGFVSKDKQWLHFAYDDNRHRAVVYSAKLPPPP